MVEKDNNELIMEKLNRLTTWDGEVTSSFVINQPETKGYKLDWDKVTSIEDIKFLMKMHWGALQPVTTVTLHLTHEMYEKHKHLVKDEG